MMSTMVQSAPSDLVRSEERQQLLSDLLDAVKQCQIRFGGRAELATESDTRVAVLCTRLEAVLSHGLRPKPISKNSSTFRQVTEIVSSSLHLNKGPGQEQLVFWHYVREHLTRHEYERYLVLKQVWTDFGRGRAWLRSSLNECSLERYLHCMLGSTNHLMVFYEEWAFLLDQERSSMLPTMAAGLGSILFAISIDNKDLNQDAVQCDAEHVAHAEPIIPASKGLDSNSKRKSEQRRRKRLQPQIISFDEDTVESHGVESLHKDTFSSCHPLPTGVAELAEEVVTEPNLSEAEQSPSGSENVTSEDTNLKSSTQDADYIRPKELGLTQPYMTSCALQNVPSYKTESRNPAIAHSINIKQNTQTLTPVNNVSVGELIPVSLTDEAYSEEDSLSVPSYSEDTECAAAALLATQRLLQTNCVNFSPQDPSANGNRSIADPSGHINGEMQEALLTLLTLKEELQAEARSLQKLLEQSEDLSTHLQAELAENTRQYSEKVEKLECRIQALVRENELLKHQLRKYVGAVQMLKRDGSQAHEALASLEAAQPKAGETSYLDYHHEAREYEKKLIQVAEMHGELMEFNDRLHRLLQVKDAIIRRLRDELVDLRGPLPDDVATSDDDVSVTSDYDNSSLCAAARALVNIWIPSAFLTGGSSDVHHVYQVFIRIRDDEWNIYRRYAQFYSLHKELKKQDAVVSTFDFPPKKTLGNKDARFVEERRRRLQHYLRCVMNHLVQTNAELASTPDKELLIGLVPFFGETCNIEDKSRRKRPSSRNPFSRLGRNTENNQSSEHSPQYTGL